MVHCHAVDHSLSLSLSRSEDLSFLLRAVPFSALRRLSRRQNLQQQQQQQQHRGPGTTIASISTVSSCFNRVLPVQFTFNEIC